MSEKQSDQETQNLWSKLVVLPAFLGIVIGFLAAFGQALLFSAGGPEAYGFCVACHTRDLVNGLLNDIFGTELGLAPFSSNSVLPTLSIVGVMVGAFVAAKMSKEYKVKNGTPVSYLKYFIGGAAVMVFALLLGACPYRAALRFGYGGMIALIGILAIFGGTFIGTRIVLKQMEKEMAD